MEPGVVQIMRSEFIDRVIYKIRGVTDPIEAHGIIMQKYSIEPGDEEWDALLAEESKKKSIVYYLN